MAYRTRSAEEWSPSLCMILARCASTVLTAIPNIVAISLIDLALRNQANDFQLSGTRLAVRLFCRLVHFERTLYQNVCDSCGQKTPTLCNAFHGFYETFAEIGFQDIPLSPSLQDAPNHLIRLVHGQNQDFDIRKRLSNLAGGLETIQFGHADIEDGDIGSKLLYLLYRLATIRGFSDNLPPTTALKKSPCSMPHQSMVVSDQNTQIHKITFSRTVSSPLLSYPD